MANSQSKVARLMSAKSAQLLDECKQIASARLPAVIKQVLDKADDALFDTADKADNSVRQNKYFDAMRELRLRRGDISEQFLALFRQSYEDTYNPLAKLREVQVSENAELSLVDSSEVEEDLAITNFIDKVKTNCREELFALEKRMGVLFSDPDMEHTKNPVGPAIIGRAFREACRDLNADIEVKLVLYKLLDRFLTPDINTMYREMNQYLIQHGILPKIASTVRRSSSQARRTRVIIESDGEQVEAAAGEDVFSTLQQLMHGSGGPGQAPGMGHGFAHGGGFAGGGGGGGYTGGGGGGGPGVGSGGGGVAGGIAGSGGFAGSAGVAGSGGMPAMFQATPMVVSRLTELQHGNIDALGPAGTGVDQDMMRAGSVNVLHMLKATGAIGTLNPTDSTTFDIVAILFDYILNDRSIPDSMKTLIGRLQIPVLKVAMLDKAVFSRKTHPVRRLLDVMANAAIGCGDGQQAQESLRDRMALAVNTVLEEFDADIAVFTRVLADFEAFLAQENAAADVRADGAAKSLRTRERVVLGKLAVDTALKPILAEPELREFARQFILDYWRQLLIVTHAEHGENSEQWRQQLGTLNDLLWSMTPKPTPEERKALSDRLPVMLRALRAGMHELEMDARKASQFLSMLSSVHVVSVKAGTEATIAERKIKALEMAGQEREQHDHDELAAAAAVAVADDQRDQFIRQGVQRLFETEGVPIGDIDVETLDIDLTAFSPVDEPIEAPPTAEAAAQDPFIEMVMTLDLGDWVEFRHADGTTLRGRFTWISPATGRYLFTNRQGQKALDTTMQGLATEFRNGTAQIFKSEPDPLFDRAIGQLMERLEVPAAV